MNVLDSFRLLGLYGLLCCFVFLIPFSSNAHNYFTEHASGWHWYDDPALHTPAPEPISNPVQQMKSIQQVLQQALDAAILEPTLEHVKTYITLQNQMSDRASSFSKMWQYVLLQNPQLDYSIAHPTNQVGREVYLDEAKQQEDRAIRQLAEHSGLFFFYRSTCPYCQRFAPIVRDFSQRYGITVIPISTDGYALPSFPNSRVDTGQAEKFHVTVEPALFTVDPYSHQAVPVSYGLTTEDELRQRLLEIARHNQE